MDGGKIDMLYIVYEVLFILPFGNIECMSELANETMQQLCPNLISFITTIAKCT